MASIKSNYIYNLLNSVTGLLFPLITFPYASRIMGPDGIGQVNFFNSIISYVSLFVGLGIPLYAIREIARVRSNERLMVKTLEEILLLHLILTALGYVVMFVMCLTIPRINSELSLFVLMSFSVIFTTIGCEWFYQGIEDFKYITVRAIIIRISCIILLFLLVRTNEDLLWYGFCGVIGTVGNNIFNFFRLRKYIRNNLVQICNLNPMRHLKSVSSVFLLTILSTVYISLNSVILGFLCDNESVGYYSSGVKIFTMTFTLVYSLTTIIIPRMSNLVAEHKDEEMKMMSQKLYKVIIAISLPMSVGLYFISPYAVILFCGQDFAPAITVSQIISPLLVVVGLSSVFGMQILYPQGRINVMIKATIIASIVDVIIVFVGAGHFSQNAASIGYLMAEIVATVTIYILGKKYIPIHIMDTSLLNYFVGSVIVGGVLWSVSYLNLNNVMMTLVMLAIGASAYAAVLVARRDPLYIDVKQIIINRIR